MKQKASLIRPFKVDVEEALKMLKSGANWYDVAVKFNTTDYTVRKSLRRAGYSTKPFRIKRPLTECARKVNVEEAIALSKRGWDTHRIARHFECTSLAVTLNFKRAGYQGWRKNKGYGPK